MKTKTIKQVPRKKIVSLRRTELDEYDLKHVEGINFSILVYSYEYGGYEGSGFAAWKVGSKWYYHELGHCSCYGPLEHLNLSKLVGLKKTDVLNIANAHYSEHGKAVANYIKQNA